MKLKNREMMNMHSALIEIGSKEGIDCVLGVSIARNNYELMRMTRPVIEEKENLLGKYGRKDKNGKLVTDKDGNVSLEEPDKYSTEYNRLMDAAGEVNLITFTMNDIKKMAPTPNQIMHLLPVITEEK